MIFVLQGWRINPFEFSIIMTLDSVVSPQVLNKYLILVDVKSGRFKYQSGRARDESGSKQTFQASLALDLLFDKKSKYLLLNVMWN